MTKIIKTTVTSANQKLAEQTLDDLLKNHGAYKIVKYKSRNSYKQLKEITAYFHNFFFTWNNQAKKIVYIETNDQIPEEFNQLNALKYEESDLIKKRFINGNFEELENLAGVGHKTASVVMSQAFGFPAFPVDTHIHRLMKQWKLTEGKNVVQTENDAKSLFPKETWNKLHLQIIFYGREYSPARGNQERDYITKMLFEK